MQITTGTTSERWPSTRYIQQRTHPLYLAVPSLIDALIKALKSNRVHQVQSILRRAKPKHYTTVVYGRVSFRRSWPDYQAEVLPCMNITLLKHNLASFYVVQGLPEVLSSG